SDNATIRQICADRPSGHVLLANRPQLLALERAARPVYAELQRDPQTRATITAIRAMKAALPPPAPIVAPARGAILPSPSATTGTRHSSLLNGTYRWLLTAAGARAHGMHPDNSLPRLVTAVLRNGTLVATTGDPLDRGTYIIDGNRFSLRLGA